MLVPPANFFASHTISPAHLMDDRDNPRDVSRSNAVYTVCSTMVNCELFSPQVGRFTCADFICAKESDTECQFDLKMTQRYKLCVTSANCHFFEH